MRRAHAGLAVVVALAFVLGVVAFGATRMATEEAGQSQAPPLTPPPLPGLPTTSVAVRPQMGGIVSFALSPDGLQLAVIGAVAAAPSTVPGAVVTLGRVPPVPTAVPGTPPPAPVGPPPTPQTGAPVATIVPAPFYSPPGGVQLPSFGYVVHQADTGAMVRRSSQTDLRWLDWSPRGTELAAAVATNGDRNEALVAMDPAGAGRRPLTPADKFNHVKFIRWSPDGNRIAFTTIVQLDYRTSDVGLWVVKSDGTGLTQLVGGPGRQFGGGIGRPDWSPDGSKVAFDVGDETAHGIYVVGSNGGTATKLTADSTYANQPKWSPDGSKIAYAVHTQSEPGTVWTMDASGANKLKLVTSPTGPVTFVAGWLDNDRIAYLAAGTDGHTIEAVGLSSPATVLAKYTKVQPWAAALSANRRVVAGVFQPYGSLDAEVRLLR